MVPRQTWKGPVRVLIARTDPSLPCPLPLTLSSCFNYWRPWRSTRIELKDIINLFLFMSTLVLSVAHTEKIDLHKQGVLRDFHNRNSVYVDFDDWFDVTLISLLEYSPQRTVFVPSVQEWPETGVHVPSSFHFREIKIGEPYKFPKKNSKRLISI